MNVRCTVQKDMCSGCGACTSACSANCISMSYDREGFLYPSIDASRCSDCGACLNVCPAYAVHSMPDIRYRPISAYAAWHTNEQIRKESSSGGVFSALSQEVLRNGGIIFGAALKISHMHVEHCGIEHESALGKLRGSKYVQSRAEHLFPDVKKQLLTGRKVLFSGTPCQIAALRAYLNKGYDHLICCDFVCAGVASPGVFRSYGAFLEKSFGSQIISLEFRDKSRGWKNNGLFTVRFQSGKTYSRLLRREPFGYGYVRGIFSRPVCYRCWMKNFRSPADITLGDFWGVEKLFPALKDDRGISMVLILSENGKKLFDRCGCVEKVESRVDDIIRVKKKLIHSVPSPKERTDFFNEYETRNMHYLVKRYLHKTWGKMIRDRCMRILKRRTT